MSRDHKLQIVCFLFNAFRMRLELIYSSPKFDVVEFYSCKCYSQFSYVITGDGCIYQDSTEFLRRVPCGKEL